MLDLLTHNFFFFLIKKSKKHLQGVPKKKKDILNIYVKSEGINIFPQKFG